MKRASSITIATTNIYFGGIRIRGDWLVVFDWLIAHGLIVRFKSERAIRYWLSKNAANPVENLIKSHKPDILIINEVMPKMRRDVLDLLTKHYKTVVMGYSGKSSENMYVACVLATRFEGRKFAIEMPDKYFCGGAVGLMIPALNTAVLAFHPAALNKKARWRQLQYVASVAEQYAKKGMHLVLGGDCNSEIHEMIAADDRFRTLPIMNYSAPSFPARTIMNRIRRPWWFPLRYFLGARNGMQRAIDNIFVPKSWTVSSCIAVETYSDHEAVVVRARIE